MVEYADRPLADILCYNLASNQGKGAPQQTQCLGIQYFIEFESFTNPLKNSLQNHTYCYDFFALETGS